MHDNEKTLPGIDVLNTGYGDFELRFDPNKPDEVQKAKETITDMLKRGYAIFVHQGKETLRVRKFDADKNVYIIGSTPAEEVPIAETRATAVGRSAGGLTMGEEAKRRIGKDLLTYAQLSRHLAEKNLAERDWSGLPVPIAGLNLVLEPRYKHKALSEFRWTECYDEDGVRHAIEEEPPPQPSEFSRVNSWWNDRYQFNIVVLKDQQGHARFTIQFEDRLAFTIRTLDAAVAWPLGAEQKAQKKLASLIPEDLFELYLLTGHFPEISKRSRVTYLFRKGRPTIALRQSEDGVSNVLCALCLHPIGYYGDTWAGVMCPTDEVIAHLLMMRGSEEKYWANANQHPLDRPAAGL